LTFIDVGGNEKYAKTMVSGLCSHYPDYALITVDAKSGTHDLPENHFNLAYSFNVPIIIVITKSDLVKEDKLTELIDYLKHKIQNDT
jgi:GTPase